MHHPEAHEFSVLQPGDQSQDARLLAPLDLRLEADEAEVIAGQIVLAQLYGRVRLAPVARIDQPDRPHRAKPQGLPPAMRHHLDRKATLEESLLVEIVHRRRFRRGERIVEHVVLFTRQRAVQIVALAVIHSARSTGHQPTWHRSTWHPSTLLRSTTETAT